MHHSALNVYCWDSGEQNRLLAQCLGPAVRELWDAGALGRFWFHRLDVRGPHVTVFLGTPAGDAEEVHQRLGERLDAYFSERPGVDGIPQDELEKRHAECRGALLCSIDALPGFAPNHSYRFADHPADGFLFRLAGGMDPEEVNRLFGELALWSLAQLRAGATSGSAIRWIAALSRALTGAGADADGFWRYYASTLLPGLRERIAAGDPEVIAGLPRLVGERNRAVMARTWEEADALPPVWPEMDRLARLIVSMDAGAPQHGHLLVREISHSVLSQLDQYVRFRIPLVLYAWLRSLPRSRLAPA